METTVAVAASKCLEAYATAQRCISDGPLSYKVGNQLQTLNSWAQQMTVFGEPHTTLDYRIGDASEIRTLFVQLLQAIGSLDTDSAKGKSSEILGASRTQETQSSPHEPQDQPETSSLSSSRSSSVASDLTGSDLLEFGVSDPAKTKETTPLEELAEQVRQNDGLINHLQRLSNAVRAASGESRAARVNAWWSRICELKSGILSDSASRVEYSKTCFQNVLLFESSVKTLLTVRFPESPPWLRDRVVDSLLFRRKRCLYLMDKQSRLSMKIPTQDIRTQPDVASMPIAKEPPIARKRTVHFQISEEPHESRPPIPAAPASNIGRVDINAFRKPPTVMLSTMTALSSADDNQIEVPPCPGNPFSNADFTCPYCNFILPFSEAVPHKWRRHVIQDLEPYVCIREECPCSGNLYSTSEDWLEHLRNIHDTQWLCSSHNHPKIHFDSEAAYHKHVTEEEGNDISETILQLLSRSNQSEDPLAFAQCPFCGINAQHISDPDAQKRFVIADIIAHLRQLAALSLIATDAEPLLDTDSVLSISGNSHGDNSTQEVAYSYQDLMDDQEGLKKDQDTTEDFFFQPSSSVFDLVPDSALIFSTESHFETPEAANNYTEFANQKGSDSIESKRNFSWPQDNRYDGHVYHFTEDFPITRLLRFERRCQRLDLRSFETSGTSAKPGLRSFQNRGIWTIRPEQKQDNFNFEGPFYVSEGLFLGDVGINLRLTSTLQKISDLGFRHPHLSTVHSLFISDQFVHAIECPVGECSLESLLMCVSSKIDRNPHFDEVFREPTSYCKLFDLNLASQLKLLQQFCSCIVLASKLYYESSGIHYSNESLFSYIDLQPANIIVNANQSIALRWYIPALGKTMGESTTERPRYGRALSRRRTAYESPETVNPNSWYDAEAGHVWSLGCILIQILTLLLGRTLRQLEQFLRSQHLPKADPYDSVYATAKCNACEFGWLREKGDALQCPQCQSDSVELLADTDLEPQSPSVFCDHIEKLMLWIDELENEANQRAKVMYALIGAKRDEVVTALNCLREMLSQDPNRRPRLSDIGNMFKFSNIKKCLDCCLDHSELGQFLSANLRKDLTWLKSLYAVDSRSTMSATSSQAEPIFNVLLYPSLQAIDENPHQCIAPTKKGIRCKWHIPDEDLSDAKSVRERASILPQGTERDQLLREFILLHCCLNLHRSRLAMNRDRFLARLVQWYSEDPDEMEGMRVDDKDYDDEDLSTDNHQFEPSEDDLATEDNPPLSSELGNSNVSDASFKSLKAVATPAGLNFAVKSFSTGFDLKPVPGELRVVLRTIAAAQSDVLRAKSIRDSLAKQSTNDKLQFLDDSVKEVEDAMKKLEARVEPIRLDIVNKGKVPLRNRVKWAMRDSKLLAERHDRLSLTHRRMLQIMNILSFRLMDTNQVKMPVSSGSPGSQPANELRLWRPNYGGSDGFGQWWSGISEQENMACVGKPLPPDIVIPGYQFLSDIDGLLLEFWVHRLQMTLPDTIRHVLLSLEENFHQTPFKIKCHQGYRDDDEQRPILRPVIHIKLASLAERDRIRIERRVKLMRRVKDLGADVIVQVAGIDLG